MPRASRTHRRTQRRSARRSRAADLQGRIDTGSACTTGLALRVDLCGDLVAEAATVGAGQHQVAVIVAAQSVVAADRTTSKEYSLNRAEQRRTV